MHPLQEKLLTTMMHLLVSTIVFAFLSSFTLAQSQTSPTEMEVIVNSTFDNPSYDISSSACFSDLRARNYSTYGDIQRFPFIGTITPL